LHKNGNTPREGEEKEGVRGEELGEKHKERSNKETE